MGIIEKLLGKRSKNATNLTSEIDFQTAAIEAARAKIAAAQAARKVAIEDFDAARHKSADEEIAEAGREIERRENAVEKLKIAHAERVEVEKREAFRREDAVLAGEGKALEARLKAEYPDAANKVANIVADLAAFQAKRKAMQERARALGEASTAEDAEDFRGVFPKRWTVTWLNDEGAATIQGPVEDAPRGSIKWVDGAPVSIREGVEVQCRYNGGRPESLVEAVGNLPKLGVGEGFFREAPEPPKPVWAGLR